MLHHGFHPLGKQDAMGQGEKTCWDTNQIANFSSTDVQDEEKYNQNIRAIFIPFCQLLSGHCLPPKTSCLLQDPVGHVSCLCQLWGSQQAEFRKTCSTELGQLIHWTGSSSPTSQQRPVPAPVSWQLLTAGDRVSQDLWHVKLAPNLRATAPRKHYFSNLQRAASSCVLRGTEGLPETASHHNAFQNRNLCLHGSPLYGWEGFVVKLPCGLCGWKVALFWKQHQSRLSPTHPVNLGNEDATALSFINLLFLSFCCL